MKQALTLLFVVSLVICHGQVSTFFVEPITTFSGYEANQDSHFVAVNRTVPTNGKLVVFIPGTGASAKFYQLLPKFATDLGYRAISIAYPNQLSAGNACGSNSNDSCYTNFRQEACFGTPVSNEIDIDSLNSISGRLIYLLKYLHVQYPNDNWDDFFIGDSLNYALMAFAGHSQGSGHALYFSKKKKVDRALLFSGPQDYNYFQQKPAAWLSSTGATTNESIFSFCHLRDEVSNYTTLYEGLNAIGLLQNDDTTLADSKTTPFGYSHCLYTNVEPKNPITPSPYHNGPIVDFNTPGTAASPTYLSVWNYMLTARGNGTGIATIALPSGGFSVFPNPASANFSIRSLNGETITNISIYDCWGEVVYEKLTNNNSQQETIAISQLAPGMYTIVFNSFVFKLVVY